MSEVRDELGADVTEQEALEGAEGELEVAGSPIVYISFSSVITEETTDSLVATLASCANGAVEEVRLLLSTPGGGVVNGMNLYNVLRGMPFRLVTHNVGNVDSVGNAVFLAGERRLACPHSTFMFHGVTFTPSAGYVMDEKALRERLESVLADQRRIAGVIAERTTLSPEEIEPLFTEARTKDAAEALRTGLVHRVMNVEVVAGAPMLSL